MLNRASKEKIEGRRKALSSVLPRGRHGRGSGMSALGQERPFNPGQPKVRFAPKADIAAEFERFERYSLTARGYLEMIDHYATMLLVRQAQISPELLDLDHVQFDGGFNLADQSRRLPLLVSVVGYP